MSLKDVSNADENVLPEEMQEVEFLDEDVEIDEEEVSAGIGNKGPYASGTS